MKEDAKPSKDSEDAFYNSQKFEVLYCGKVTVAHKKAPSSLIDDCIEKFSLHERQRLKLLSEQRNNESSLDLALCEGNAPASPLDSPFEELESPNTTTGHAVMFTIGSQNNLTSLASTRSSFPERILEDSGFDEQQEIRVTAVMQRRVHDANLKTQPRRRHASAPSHVQPSDSEKNRTMLFQVGRFEVNLISPDTKSVVLEKNFKDISSCSQVDEVMLTLKQAFSTAAALQSAKTQVKLCEACPMHSLHKLCERIEGLYPPRAKLVIQRHLSSLTDNEQADIFERVQKMKPENDQEENELVILHLRQLCEAKQKTHIHIGEAPSTASNSVIPENTTSGGRFKLDVLKNKAKKSLTSSLENIFSRGANRMRGRLGSVDSFERCNSLVSDKDASPGDSPPTTPPASPVSSAWQPFPEEDSDSPQFRRRAHTFSHPPSSSRRRITFQNGRSLSARSPLLRQSSIEPTSDGEGKKRASNICSSESLNAVGATLTPRRISWRQRIFLRVASPMNKSASKMQHPDSHDGSELLPLSPLAPPLEEDPLLLILQNEDGTDKTGEKKNSEELQSLWRKAIHQQILLLRMEKENQKLEASRDELQSRKVKLDYDEVGTCQKDVINVWDKKLLNCRAKIRCDMEDIHGILKEGVPKSRRGEIWQFLAVQHRVRHRLPNKQQPPDVSYKELLKQLTAQQHAILVDLGINKYLSASYFLLFFFLLWNLKSVQNQNDKEIVCHRVLFLIQMYQLSRLLHDYHRDLYNHLEENEISPSLYAAPWFLTLFASQFPLGFVARVFDIIFLQGTEVIFKVALSLLSSQETAIMGCESFENIVDFLKTTIPDMTQPQMEKIITQVFEMDISKQLHAYEVEYHVLQDELQENVNLCDDGEPLEKLERANNHLKRQNMDLLEKLQVAHAKIQSLESSLEAILTRENKMKTAIQSLEQEKITYQKTLEQIIKYLPTEALSDCELHKPGYCRAAFLQILKE
uniref:TBC1 domain family member 4 n=1 Tax=Chrysolophus pictus TaxID=9089 RepID=A0A8C3LZ94_CHRPC